MAVNDLNLNRGSSFKAVTWAVCAAVIALQCLVSPAGAADRKGPLGVSHNSPMLEGDWVPRDTHQIDCRKLPRVPSQHAVISDVRDRDGRWVHQHAYLAHYAGRYWAMWSDGPGVRKADVPAGGHRNLVPGHDRAGTRVSYATSLDGIDWSKPGDLSGPPRKEGFGWIARGLWVRDGELLAMASHFHAPGYAGPGLSLEAFRWDEDNGPWEAHGSVRDDSMNNFPPKKLPSGEWMMTRRDHRRQVSVMIGGVAAFDDWRINPLASYDGKGRPEEPYWYVLPDGRNIVGLIRDNGGSKFLLRTFSSDNGRTWSKIRRTNFPDATSKFYVHHTSRGYYVMASNSNPRKRDPMTLAVSQDGVTYDRMFWLVGDRHIDYPHIIEHGGRLLIAFSGAKQTMEVMTVALDDLEKLEMPKSVELEKPAPKIGDAPRSVGQWIDLGDEGAILHVAFEMIVPQRGEEALLSLATASGLIRVTLGVDSEGRLVAGLFKARKTGKELPVGRVVSVRAKIVSHRGEPDELFVRVGNQNDSPLETRESGEWTLINRDGRSDANLARSIIRGGGRIREVRVAADVGQIRDK